jgi:hypothetical protein
MDSKGHCAGGKAYSGSPRRHLQLGAVMLLLALPRAGAAQDATNPDLRRAIDAIRPNTLLRIETTGVHTGRLLSKSADSLLLGESGGSKQLAIVDIRTVAESRRNVRRGAIVGGIIGAIGFGAIGLLSGGAICKTENDCKTTPLGGLAAGGLLGLIGGSLGGAAAGYMQHGWRFLYPPSVYVRGLTLL